MGAWKNQLVCGRKLIHTENDWYSAAEGQGEISYPAPFDQPFCIIRNLAVGGSWPGNPDETTDIANSAYYADYVRVYQKDSYDENVKKPVKDVILRDPDADGNYIINVDFKVQEDLTDGKDWTFLTVLGGEASASIANNEIAIKTDNEGTVDYSVQLVQPALPMKKGAAGSTAGIHISNVSLKKIKEIDITEGDKGILADGNYVYNGGFQEGEGCLGYWNVSGNEGAKVSVTNDDNIRRLKVEAPEGTTAENPVMISQEALAIFRREDRRSWNRLWNV